MSADLFHYDDEHWQRLGGIIDRTKVAGAREKFMAMRDRVEMRAGFCKAHIETAVVIVERDYRRYRRVERAARALNAALEGTAAETVLGVQAEDLARVGRIETQARLLSKRLPMQLKTNIRNNFFLLAFTGLAGGAGAPRRHKCR